MAVRHGSAPRIVVVGQAAADAGDPELAARKQALAIDAVVRHGAVAIPLERMIGRIAGVTEMTSSSGHGATNVTLQFDLSRAIDSAARDVQAAINAARGQLPATLPNNPNYR